jgi:hypothetical protein
MSQPVLDPVDLGEAPNRLRHPLRQHPDEALVLSELEADSVVDHLDDTDDAIELITFGTTRECCPKCRHTHLRLVLRQRRVRLAHLFCAECHSCFDAHYSNGNSALSI